MFEVLSAAKAAIDKGSGDVLIVLVLLVLVSLLSLLLVLFALLLSSCVVVVVVVTVVVPTGQLGGPWTKYMFFKKKVFSPRPEATVQANFNAKTHLFNI